MASWPILRPFSVRRQIFIGPKIAAADAGAGYGDYRVGWLDKVCMGTFSIRTAPAPNMTVARMVIYFRFSRAR
jgi:hypothetical protein